MSPAGEESGGQHVGKTPPLPIIFESDDFVAIHKPSGLASIPGRGEADSALHALARLRNLPCAGAADPRLRVVHRLDKDTSGVLLFARHVEAQRRLSHQFQNNTVEKQYLAIVHGVPQDSEGAVDGPIGVHPTDRKRMHVSRHGRPALTLWRVEQRFRSFALLRCFPRTGKTHQIRVHLVHIGHPLAIDPIYGSSEPLLLSRIKRGYRAKRGEEERPLISRLTLHAESLSFDDLSGNRQTLRAELPKDFRSTLNQLAKAR